MEKGNISINAENIFPIIKKWLYSEKDIFIRELVSNSSDAISKLKKLAAIGEADGSKFNSFKIKVTLNKEMKTISVEDNGIGMTADEVKKYINQIAFSGAKDFLEKYKDKTDEGQIIGHFGLGFYSSFMVADKVIIDTLSFQDGAKAVKWESEGGMDFEMSDSEKSDVGTKVTLFMTEDSHEFLDEFKMRETLKKYFSFLPYELYLENEKSEEEKIKEATKTTEDTNENDDTENAESNTPQAPTPLNDTNPLWTKNPRDCTDEDYKAFYRNVFNDFNEPLFWIHLNMDYPFNLKGILYFPKLKHEFETMEGQIKLFYNQVFVADNIKEVIPEYLLLLKGTIDCPDLPLNVSRSFLQNDGYVNKISAHISKKVADKLVSLYENEKDNFVKYWDDINPFVKYGCLKDEKMYDRVKEILIFKTTNDDYVTLKEYLERNKEKHENKVYYVNDEKNQSQYINMFKEHDMEAVILSTMIDSHFISFLEMKEHSIKFNRIDAEITDNMKEEKDEASEEAIKKEEEVLGKLFKEVTSDSTLTVKIEKLKSSNTPAIMLLSEQSRRMQEMSRMFGGMQGMNFPTETTLVLNRANNLVQWIYDHQEEASSKDDLNLVVSHIYDLALMSHKGLDAEGMTKFIQRSNMLLLKLVEK